MSFYVASLEAAIMSPYSFSKSSCRPVILCLKPLQRLQKGLLSLHALWAGHQSRDHKAEAQAAAIQLIGALAVAHKWTRGEFRYGQLKDAPSARLADGEEPARPSGLSGPGSATPR